MKIKSDIYTLVSIPKKLEYIGLHKQICDSLNRIFNEPGIIPRVIKEYRPEVDKTIYYLKIVYEDEESRLSFKLKYTDEYIKEIIIRLR